MLCLRHWFRSNQKGCGDATSGFRNEPGPIRASNAHVANVQGRRLLQRDQHAPADATPAFLLTIFQSGGPNGLEELPVNDPLHVLKNMRQRVRNREMQVRPGGPIDSGSRIDDALGGGFTAIAEPGRRHEMNDALAVQAFDPAIALACIDLSLPDAAIFFAPWALLYAAIASDADAMSRDARLRALEVAFAMFRTEYLRLREPHPGLVQRGPVGERVTLADLNQLRRAMNLCIAVYAALVVIEGGVALGRIGTHPVEAHFGIARAALRGVSNWRSWVSGQAFASMIPELRSALELDPRQARRSRVVSAGATVPAASPPGALTGFRGDLTQLLPSARVFMSGRTGRLAQLFVEYLSELV
jgi:hypothetical protein